MDAEVTQTENWKAKCRTRVTTGEQQWENYGAEDIDTTLCRAARGTIWREMNYFLGERENCEKRLLYAMQQVLRRQLLQPPRCADLQQEQPRGEAVWWNSTYGTVRHGNKIALLIQNLFWLCIVFGCILTFSLIFWHMHGIKFGMAAAWL